MSENKIRMFEYLDASQNWYQMRNDLEFDDSPNSVSISDDGSVLAVGQPLSDEGGVITVAAIAGRYGRVFLTYNMATNPKSKTQGSFTGRAMGIDDAGNREFAVRAGVWTRSGTTLTLHSLDDLTDGTQNLCKSELNLTTGKFQMTFYPM